MGLMRRALAFFGLALVSTVVVTSVYLLPSPLPSPVLRATLEHRSVRRGSDADHNLFSDVSSSLSQRAGTASSRSDVVQPQFTLEELRDNRPNNTIVIYLHIPKTAGTVLSSSVQRSTPGQGAFVQWWTFPRPDDLPQLRRAAVLFGHLPFGTHKLLPDRERPYTYVAFFRHPYERVVSHFHYHLSMPHDVWHALALTYRHNISQWVRVSEDANNLQTQFLAGVGAFWNADDPLILSAAEVRRSVWRFTKPRVLNITEEIYQRAVYNLDRYISFVGMTERFEESLHMMKEWLGVYNITYRVNKVTRHPRFSELPPDAQEAIRQYNQYDMRLYAHALARFEEQVERYGRVRLREDMVRFRPTLAAYNEAKLLEDAARSSRMRNPSTPPSLRPLPSIPLLSRPATASSPPS